ncbi:MAG: metallophosphoesterase [Bacteroidaceae bacterium]|nr:metallophosphoesterase [Bacteroidaceae bacterium]
MDRRQFLKSSALLAAAAEVPSLAQSVTPVPADDIVSSPEQPLIISAPMLQNYAENSMGVAFAVSDMANGFVTYGLRPDLSDGITVKCGGFRVTDINRYVMLVRLTGLQPATTYYYRIGADRVDYRGGYNMHITSTEQDPRIYSFITAGSRARAHFCVINDTHASWKPFGLAVEKIASLRPSCVVWNGDATNCEEKIERLRHIFLTPEIQRADYAACTPYLLCPGNHDCRGMASRHLEQVWMYRQPDERPSAYWDLGRNFAVRMGAVALVGLDTAEDKLDENPLFAGLFTSAPYREAQTRWLRDVLRRPEIASAPFLVAICHIPLFDADPKSNPGDVRPADSAPQYSTDYAMWQRTCANLWAPLLEEARCQLVITAHQHRYRYDAPTAQRPWAQIVGGGPEMHLERGEFPTVIEGSVSRGRLIVNVHNLLTDAVQEQFTFSPR